MKKPNIYIRLREDNKIEAGYSLENLTFDGVAAILAYLKLIERDILEYLDSFEKEVDFSEFKN